MFFDFELVIDLTVAFDHEELPINSSLGNSYVNIVYMHTAD